MPNQTIFGSRTNYFAAAERAGVLWGGLGVAMISIVANNPQLVHAVTTMLSNDGGQGWAQRLDSQISACRLG